MHGLDKLFYVLQKSVSDYYTAKIAYLRYWKMQCQSS